MWSGIYRTSYTPRASRPPSLPSILEESEVASSNHLCVRLNKKVGANPLTVELKLYKVDTNNTRSSNRSTEVATPIEISDEKLKTAFIKRDRTLEGMFFKDKDTLLGIDRYSGNDVLPHLKIISYSKQPLERDQLATGMSAGDYIVSGLYFTVARPHLSLLQRTIGGFMNRRAGSEGNALLGREPALKNTTRALLGWYNISTGEFFAITPQALQEKNVMAMSLSYHLSQAHWEDAFIGVAIESTEQLLEEIYRTRHQSRSPSMLTPTRTQSSLRSPPSIPPPNISSRQGSEEAPHTPALISQQTNAAPTLTLLSVESANETTQALQQLSIEDPDNKNGEPTQSDKKKKLALAKQHNTLPLNNSLTQNAAAIASTSMHNAAEARHLAPHSSLDIKTRIRKELDSHANALTSELRKARPLFTALESGKSKPSFFEKSLAHAYTPNSSYTLAMQPHSSSTRLDRPSPYSSYLDTSRAVAPQLGPGFTHHPIQSSRPAAPEISAITFTSPRQARPAIEWRD